MRKFLSLVFGLVFLGGCQLAPSSLAVTQTSCLEPRADMCTMDYQPVCGLNKKGISNVYSNACVACGHEKTVSYSNGECNI